MAQAGAILRRVFPQIPTHGFTRRAIAHSVPGDATPLSETAISALFGPGDAAQRTLIRAWLNEGRMHMSTATPSTTSKSVCIFMEDVLLKRLEWNEPVLPHLKDVRIPLFSWICTVCYSTCPENRSHATFLGIGFRLDGLAEHPVRADS